MKNSIFITFFFASILILGQTSFAQELKRCATHELDSISTLRNPNRAFNRQLFEDRIKSYLADNQANARVSNSVIRIPVVVHVVHSDASGNIGGATSSNISDEQIFSQIQVLNEDYRKKINTLGYNSNPVGADTGIEFFLALRDPNGNPTNGITRNYSSQTTFNILNDSDLQKLASLASWDSNKYLNLWVTKISSGYLGITPTFNWDFALAGTQLSDGDAALDGCIIDYRYFGKKIGTSLNGIYSDGRTATHEIGHFFGLIHTWGDQYCGTDYCNDTPAATASNNTRFCTDVFSTCNGVRTRNMIENYLDYSPDSCMNIFTNDQKARMYAVMQLSQRRQNLINYAASLDLPFSSNLQVSILPNPAEKIIQLQILFADFQNFSVTIYDEMGRTVWANNYVNLPSTVLNITPAGFPDGKYFVKVITAKESQVKRLIYTN